MKAGGRMGRTLFCTVIVALVGAVVLATSASGQTETKPPFLLAEEPAPTTANIACEPSKQHPYPVVLVHGTFEDAKQNWEVLSDRLKAQGYCVFALNYGNRGLEPIQGSARELDRFVDKVLKFTGAKRVQVVGHSQGGMMPRYWIKFYGGASKVEDLVGIAPSNYGTQLSEDPREAEQDSPCYSCGQQGAGSRFLKRLNSGDDTPGDGDYTVIATNDDEIIIPFRNCFLKGERRTVNLVVQDYNNGALVTHQNIYNDPYAQALVFDALANPGTADPNRAEFPPPPPPTP
jgi:triacylglycerol lipase